MARASSIASASAAALAAPRELLISFSISPCPSSPTCTITLAHRLQQRPRAGEVLGLAAGHDRQRAILRARGAAGDGRVEHPHPALGQRRTDAAGVGGAIVDMSTHSSPVRAGSRDAVLAEQHGGDLLAVDDHAHDDVARTRDLGGGVDRATASCSAAHRAALPGVCVQTVSGKPARRTLAAIREPMIPRPRNPIRSGIREKSCPLKHPRGILSAQASRGIRSAQGFSAEFDALEHPRIVAHRDPRCSVRRRRSHARERPIPWGPIVQCSCPSPSTPRSPRARPCCASPTTSACASCCARSPAAAGIRRSGRGACRSTPSAAEALARLLASLPASPR